MSDGLTSKQIDALVLDVVKEGGAVRLYDIVRTLTVKVYPFSRERREKAVTASLRRLRKRYEVIHTNASWRIF